jgi:hemolysin III
VQTPDVKPLLRGHFHQAAFFFTLGACGMLLAKAHSLHVFIPTLIYALSLSAMFGISALYHRPKWSAGARVVMKRIDHSAIFVLIAGTSTPLFMLALPHDLGLQLMIMIWVVAAFGVAKCLLWVHSPKWVSAILYVGVGWLASSNLGAIRTALGPGGFNCLLLGGVLYSIGAFIYAFRWPDPSPKYFGYHEIFHVLVILAAALHFIAVQPFVR